MARMPAVAAWHPRTPARDPGGQTNAAGGSALGATLAAARVAGFDGILDLDPAPPTSDDLHVAVGMPVCDSAGTISNPTRQTTARKPPTYLDAMFASQVFWDGRAGY